MKICKYKKCEICTNADSEVVADFPSSKYCGKCKLYEPGDKDDALDHLRYLLDFYVIAEVRRLHTAHVGDDGKIEFDPKLTEAAVMAYSSYGKAKRNYREEYCNED